MAPLGDRLDVAVVRRHHQGDTGSFREPHERREEIVVEPEHLARTRIIHRMAGDVSLEELVEREVVFPGDGKEMLRRPLRRDDRDVGVPVLDRLAREILHEGTVVGQFIRRRNHLGRRQGHDGRHRLEPACRQLRRRVDEIGVGELHLLAAPLEFEEEIVVFDDLPQGGTRKTLAMSADRLGTIDAREHRRLARRRLRQPLDAQTGVNRLRMTFDETPQRRTHLRIHRIVRRRCLQSNTVNKEKNNFHSASRPVILAVLAIL